MPASPLTLETTLLEWVAPAVLLVSASYLLCRLLSLALRVRRARSAHGASGAARAECADGELLDRCSGALVGFALGDALGLPAESLPRWLTRWRYPSGPELRGGIARFLRRRGAVSDDTQQTICVARSFEPAAAGPSYLHERFIDELRLWHGYRIGAGRASTVAARRLRRDPAAPSGVASEGNGAAMRVLPFAVAHARRATPDELLRDVEQNARCTHTSPVAVAAAKLYALLAWHALRAPRASLTGETLAALVPRLASSVGLTLLAGGVPKGRPRRPPSGHAGETLIAVVQSLATTSLQLEVAMRRVFFAGGDTDTVGAMVGGIIGAQLGLSALPERWVNAVQHSALLVALASRLVEAAPARSRAAAVVDVEGDVATRAVDVVVNAWNRNVLPSWLLLPSGVSRAIRRAGGARAIREISRRGPMPLGAAWETPGFGLPARWVIHVAGIDLTWRASERSVRRSTRNALLLARTLGATTIAFPLIGAGTGGLSPEHVRAWMLEEIRAQTGAFERVELVRPASVDR